MRQERGSRRHDIGPHRAIQTGVGPVEVRRAKVRDRGEVGTEEKIRLAVSCEDAARRFDPRITNSDGASLSTRWGETALANSLGFGASYPATVISLAVEVMADDADGNPLQVSHVPCSGRPRRARRPPGGAATNRRCAAAWRVPARTSR